jgi:hypothetical protein
LGSFLENYQVCIRNFWADFSTVKALIVTKIQKNWATFWAFFSQANLVNLRITPNMYMYLKKSAKNLAKIWPKI